MLDNNFFEQGSTKAITRNLLGHELVYQSPAGTVAGLIVEAEAYLGVLDSTAHAYRGRRSPANEALYGPPGTIYIYSLRGHYMLDIATQAADEPQGILIRGLEPTQGLELMQARRRKTGFELTNGPAKLTQALGITSLAMNLKLLGEVPLTISQQRLQQPQQIAQSPRINVSARGNWTQKPLRFFVAHNPYVSQMRKTQIDQQHYGWQSS